MSDVRVDDETAVPDHADAGRSARNRSTDRRSRLVALVLVALALLWVAASNDFGANTVGALVPTLTIAAIYSIAAVGLNFQFGQAGLLNFGFVAFMAVGAYVTVLLVPHRVGQASSEIATGWPLPVAVLAGMVVAALLGLLFGLPAVRLRTDYLAIVMIAAAEILRILLRDTPDVTGGVFGILGYSGALQDLRPGFVDSLAEALQAPAFQLWLLLLSWFFLLVVTLAIAALMRTPWGRLLRAVRDDEDAVRSLGKRPTVLKLQSLMIGGAIGGLSGALLAFSAAQLNPDLFIPQVTFFVFTIVILGGTASTWGPAVGGVIFWVLLNQSGAFIADNVGSGTTAAALRYILVGALMAMIIVFRPQGLLGRRDDVVLEVH